MLPPRIRHLFMILLTFRFTYRTRQALSCILGQPRNQVKARIWRVEAGKEGRLKRTHHDLSRPVVLLLGMNVELGVEVPDE
jgi:hypothetical protein